jgi:hypothetical protein
MGRHRSAVVVAVLALDLDFRVLALQILRRRQLARHGISDFRWILDISHDHVERWSSVDMYGWLAQLGVVRPLG